MLGLYDYTTNTGQVRQGIFFLSCKRQKMYLCNVILCYFVRSYTPVSFVTNPSFNSQTVDWDFAVITLSKDVVFTPAISPVCLPASTDSFYENK